MANCCHLWQACLQHISLRANTSKYTLYIYRYLDCNMQWLNKFILPPWCTNGSPNSLISSLLPKRLSQSLFTEFPPPLTPCKTAVMLSLSHYPEWPHHHPPLDTPTGWIPLLPTEQSGNQNPHPYFSTSLMPKSLTAALATKLHSTVTSTWQPSSYTACCNALIVMALDILHDLARERQSVDTAQANTQHVNAFVPMKKNAVNLQCVNTSYQDVWSAQVPMQWPALIVMRMY